MVYSGVISDLAAPTRFLTFHRETRSATVDKQLATLSQCAGQRSSESRNVITTFKHFQKNVFTGLWPIASCAPTPYSRQVRVLCGCIHDVGGPHQQQTTGVATVCVSVCVVYIVLCLCVCCSWRCSERCQLAVRSLNTLCVHALFVMLYTLMYSRLDILVNLQ